MKSGVNLSEWTQSVNKANSTGIGKMKTVSFLKQMLDLYRIQNNDRANQFFSESYKEFAKGSTNKMIAAGKNKANDDKAELLL